jgi:hypothetical protein
LTKLPVVVDVLVVVPETDKVLANVAAPVVRTILNQSLPPIESRRSPLVAMLRKDHCPTPL